MHSRSKMQKPFLLWTREECSVRWWLRSYGNLVSTSSSRPQGSSIT